MTGLERPVESEEWERSVAVFERLAVEAAALLDTVEVFRLVMFWKPKKTIKGLSLTPN